MVFKNIKPSKLIHINNYYEIINKNKDDYIINIYYLEKNKIQIKVRKINNIEGWNNNMKIKIYYQNNIENFDIGSSNKNVKVVNMYSELIKFSKKKIKKLKIPKVIIQTHNDNIFNDELAYNSILSYIDFNPEFEYIFFNDKDCREFIKENFDNGYLYYYDILYPSAFKADFFRYCYLYKKGGCYFDCKSIILNSINNVLKEEDELVLCQDYHN